MDHHPDATNGNGQGVQPLPITSSTTSCSTPDGPAGNHGFALDDVQYLTERAVDLGLAWSEGLRSGQPDKTKEQDQAEIGSQHRAHGLGRILSSHLIVPYFQPVDGVARIRIRVHHTHVVILGDENAGHIIEEDSDYYYARWLATRGASAVPYIPQALGPVLEDQTVPIHIVEAPVKALSMYSHGYHALAVAGVEAGFLEPGTGFRRGKDAPVIHRELCRVAWRGRVVPITYDAGIWGNPAVARGAAKLAQVLRAEGAGVRLAMLPLARPTDVRQEMTDLGITDESVCMREFLAANDSGDQGPDDFLARQERYAMALGHSDPRGYAARAFQRLVAAAVPADAGEWAAVVAEQHTKRADRIRALTELLQQLPFRGLLAVGGSAAIEAVAAHGIGKKAIKEAIGQFQDRVRQQTTKDEPAWRKDLARNADGLVLPSIGNVLKILSHDERWQGALAYDLFGERTVLRQAPPWDGELAPSAEFMSGQQVTDTDATRLIAWLEDHYGIKPNPKMAQAIIDVAAEHHGYHPVREWLSSIRWDGQARMAGTDGPGWLTTYLGAQDSPYVRRVGRIWLIAMIARVFKPGCLVKTVPVLEGKQDDMKSMACRVLADPWASDSLSEVGTKDSYQDLRGKWLIEVGEMAAMSRAEVGDLKHFISKPVDNYRESYGRRNRDVPRQCILVGTVNGADAGYLMDNTGNSRFLPVRVGVIDIDALKRDRDQLLAEALHAYRAGEPWWVDRDDSLLADVRAEPDVGT